MIDASFRPQLERLERLLAQKRVAGSVLLDFDMWDRWGRTHASDDEVREREAAAGAAQRSRGEAVAALEHAVAQTSPDARAAWAAAHDALLAAFAAAPGRDSTAVFVAGEEREAWGRVARGEQAFVDENVFYISIDPASYREIFGFDLPG